MQLSMKCSVAIHCLIYIWEGRDKVRVTSPLLAQSTGCNPVIIRNLLSALKKAGLITVDRGPGGARLCRDPHEITLYQIYMALEPKGLTSLIGIHPCQNRPCPVAQNIRAVLQKPYHRVAQAIADTMQDITLASMIEDFEGLSARNCPDV